MIALKVYRDEKTFQDFVSDWLKPITIEQIKHCNSAMAVHIQCILEYLWGIIISRLEGLEIANIKPAF